MIQVNVDWLFNTATGRQVLAGQSAQDIAACALFHRDMHRFRISRDD
jgi:hypothetical protein